MQEGADQFFTKPVEFQALLVVLRRLLESHRTARKLRAAASGPHAGQLDPFLGASAAIRRLAEHARRIAAAESPVLIQGPTGASRNRETGTCWTHRPHRETDRDTSISVSTRNTTSAECASGIGTTGCASFNDGLECAERRHPVVLRPPTTNRWRSDVKVADRPTPVIPHFTR